MPNKENEKRFAKAQQIARLGSWELNFATNIVLLSDDSCRIYGLTKEENQQTLEMFFSFVHPDDLTFVKKSITDSLSLLKEVSITYRIIRKDGAIRYIHSESRVEFDEQGKPLGFHGTTQDITGIKNMEDELRKSETNLRTIFENTDVGFLFLSNTYAVIAFNKICIYWAANIFGIELTGNTNFRELLHAGKKLAFDAFATSILSGNAINYETSYATPNKTLMWFTISGKPVIDDEKVTGICIAITDITARKAAEDKIIRISNLNAFIGQVNQNIVHIKEKKDLFKNSCSIACEFGKFKIAWIGIFDEEHKTISLVEQTGLPENDVRLFVNMPYVPGGPQENLRLNGGYYVSNDTENEPALKEWVKLGEDLGVGSCMLLGIKKQGNVIGSLNLYSAEKNFFDGEKIALLQEVTRDISFALDMFDRAEKQKEAEQQILKNEKRFRALVEKSSDMQSLSDATGKVLYGSPSIKRGLGYTSEEFLLKYPYHLIHANDIQDYLEKRNKLLQTPGGSFNFQQRRLHKNGTWIWCEGTIVNMIDESGINALVTNFRDVSERKLADEAKQFDKNNLSALINNTNDLMWSVDRNFNLITANKAFDEMSVANFGRVIAPGTSILSAAYTPEMLSHYKQSYERAFAGESFCKTDYFDTPFVFWVEISYSPISRDDEIIGTACYSRDITERKKTETAINELNEKLQGANLQMSTILNTLPANIALLDATGTIIAVNEAWKKFGIENNLKSSNYCLGDNYIKVSEKATGNDKRDGIKIAAGTRQVLAGLIGEFAMEYPCHSPTEQRWFRVEVRPLTKHKHPGAVVMHINISEQKLAEIEIRGLNEHLEQRVHERTAELTEANTALETFSYSVSHDLRSPVRSVMGFAKIMAQKYSGDLSIEGKEMLGYIETSGRRMNTIIDDLLRLAKYGNDKLKLEPVDMTEMIKDLWANMLLNHPHHAVLELEPLPVIKVDRSMMQQVVINFLSNAVKYSSKKEKPVVKIWSEQTNDNVIFYFKDNGAGFDMLNYGHLFAAFQRLHGPSEFEGIGIGLTLIKRIIEKHGGTVGAEGKVGEGATFHFTLPVQQLLVPLKK